MLDTHALLWVAAEPEQLADPARAAITSAENEVSFSASSVWELAIKSAAGRLEVPEDLVEQVVKQNYRALDITVDHAAAAGALPPHHRDPFDRMLIAQAQLEGLTVVTRDPQFARYDVNLLAA